jgi:hypothetical protein
MKNDNHTTVLIINDICALKLDLLHKQYTLKLSNYLLINNIHTLKGWRYTMNRTGAIFSFLFLMITGVHAIGLQHGLFRSQSTQGDPWQGTAQIIREHYDITVFPDYLDVELEWEFKVGGTVPAAYKDALEIVGNLNFVQNSVVISMITWYKDMILKGKLKTNNVAREQYENVVQRSSDAPPPPRDPVLLEYVRDDNYDISIFPAEYGKTRQVRIRYLIPAFEVNGVNKISYPHAFTDSATVTIKNGPGVKGYTLETAIDIVPYFIDSPVQLDRTKFEFMPYRRGTGRESIEFIVPELLNQPSGSVIYSGAFSTEAMSGEVAHLITMSADKALLNTSIPQDFVILWRWNHPEVLVKYAGQIVRQSKQLIRFLNTLGENGKRAALIISMQGGERITFELDSPGSDQFKKMLKWLDDVSKHDVIEPEFTTASKKEIQFDVEKAIGEFNDAIKAALDMFDSGSKAMKQFILLTAGPRLVTNYTARLPEITWNSSIAINSLSDYENESVASAEVSGDRAETMYWPGIDISKFLQNDSSKVKVTAKISNGDRSYLLNVSPQIDSSCKYCGMATTTEAHLFSNPALKKEIIWRVEQGDYAVEFTETPAVVSMDDGLQYARLIGSSRYLNPLAAVMPSSIASSVGFIDEKYSLVALEEDALSKDIAAQYNEQGVPLLESKDIFKSSDERTDLPVADWLKANPPETMAKGLYGMYTYTGVWRGDLLFDKAVPAVFEMNNGTAFGRVAMPAIDPVYAEALDATFNYDALDTRPGYNAVAKGNIQIALRQGFVEIDLSGMNSRDRDGLSIVVYNLNGRIVNILRASSRSIGQKIVLSGNTASLSRGVYIIKVVGKGISVSRKVVIK